MDSSALLKRYIEEPDSNQAEGYLLADPDWVTARFTTVEVRRNLYRLLEPTARQGALAAFSQDWSRMIIIDVDVLTCESAAAVAEMTGARSLDALHIAAAIRLGGRDMTMLTFDIRQAAAARALGLRVIGA